MPDRKPKLLITTGDPNGIGPEIALKALLDERLWKRCRPMLVGCPGVLKRAARTLGMKHPIRICSGEEEAPRPAKSHGRRQAPAIPVIAPDAGPYTKPAAGIIEARAGRMAYRILVKANDLISRGLGDAMVTCPINKEALHRAGLQTLAHTEILAELTRSSDPITLFIAGRLRIAFFTRHLPLSQVVRSIRKTPLVRFVKRLHAVLNGIGMLEPRLAMAALNPHAGEGGLLGKEEIEQIEPAIIALRKSGIDIEGPIPADSVFHAAREGKFDCVVSLYHDQGHIAAKTARFHDTVSLTLGLPYLRSSVDHGTGFDIAWKGIARADSLIAATLAAARLVSRQRRR
jgi:4-hydroxythreonine-4-phosphate dehydrogenase